MFSRVLNATVNGVRAYARAPMRSEKPPKPVRVLCNVESSMGVTQVL